MPSESGKQDDYSGITPGKQEITKAVVDYLKAHPGSQSHVMDNAFLGESSALRPGTVTIVLDLKEPGRMFQQLKSLSMLFKHLASSSSSIETPVPPVNEPASKPVATDTEP